MEFIIDWLNRDNIDAFIKLRFGLRVVLIEINIKQLIIEMAKNAVKKYLIDIKESYALIINNN